MKIEEIKAEGFIWNCILFLLFMFFAYLVYFLYLVITNQYNKEGFGEKQQWNRLQGITNICSPNDADYNSPECIDISFVDYDNSINSVKAILDPGYGVDPYSGFVIYFGAPTQPKFRSKFITPSTTRDIFARDYTVNQDDTTPTSKNNDFKFDKDNINLEYHNDPSKMENAQDDLIGYALVKNSQGQIVPIPYSDVSGQTIYDSPGTSRFGPSSYVPNYEETVFLSKLTNEMPFLPISKQESGSVGFCQQNASDSLSAIEKKCNSLDNETCASTDCCVLLGGEKCVAGSETGASIQSNYKDVSLKNTDYYYYKGKCYGNCSRSYGIKNTSGYNDTSIIEAATFSPSINNNHEEKRSEITRVPWIPPKWDESSQLNDTGNWNNWYKAMVNGAVSYR